MDSVKKFLDKAISGGSCKRTDLKKAIVEDYMNSHMVIFNNDTTSTLIVKNGAETFQTLFDQKAAEGMFGEDMESRLDDVSNKYSHNKKEDDMLTYSFNTKFFATLGIGQTWKVFKEAIQANGELSQDGCFNVNAANITEKKDFVPYEVLIVKNMAKIEEQFDNDASFSRVKKYKDLICTLSTILVLKGIAQNGEEKQIDKLAVQLLDFMTTKVRHDNKKLDNETLINSAIVLAETRLKNLNNGKTTYIANYQSLLDDERLFQEMNKTCKRFAEYNVNLTGKGSNGSLVTTIRGGKTYTNSSFVSGKGYENIVKISKKLARPNMTEEDLMKICLTDLIIVANASKLEEKQKKGLCLGFVLPVVQVMNKIGSVESKEIFNDSVVFLKSLEGEDKALLEELGFDIKVLSTPVAENSAANAQEKIKPELSPEEKKAKLEKAIRKQLAKALDKANKSHYNSVKKGLLKKETDQKLQMQQLVVEFAGKWALNKKELENNPEKCEMNDNSISSQFVKNFSDYIFETAPVIASFDDEERKQVLKDTKKELKNKYVEDVKKHKFER